MVCRNYLRSPTSLVWPGHDDWGSRRQAGTPSTPPQTSAPSTTPQFSDNPARPILQSNLSSGQRCISSEQCAGSLRCIGSFGDSVCGGSNDVKTSQQELAVTLQAEGEFRNRATASNSETESYDDTNLYFEDICLDDPSISIDALVGMFECLEYRCRALVRKKSKNVTLRVSWTAGI